MGIIILLGVFALVTLAAIGVAVFSEKTRLAASVTAIGTGLVGLVILLASSVTTVGTSDVGIETAFGRTVTDLAPGMHLIAPWADVTMWDGSVQTISYPRGDGCLEVRIGGQQSACLAVTFQFQVRASAADFLFRKYRTQANMNEYLVTRALDQAINTQLATFSPIEAAAAGNPDAASLVPFESKIVAQMNAEMGSVIKVGSLFIPFATYDASTTQRLNAIQTQHADTLIALEAEKTAAAQAAAYKILQQQLGSASAAVVAAQCFANVMVPIVKAGGNPAGISCWPGGGGSSTVVVPKP
jgi:hypothetical protein